MSLRPIAASVVLAAALLSTSVLRDGGAGVVPDAGSATPVPSSTAVAEVPGASPSAAPASSPAAGGPSPSAGPSAPSTPSATPGGPAVGRPGQTAADRFDAWYHGSRQTKLVALTFDDGWNLKYTQRIFAILRARQAPATFFPVARAVLRHPQTWRSIAAAGFPIGNHSWNHDDLAKVKWAKAQADMTRATRAIERTTGTAMFEAIRPPYGAYDASFIKAAKLAGMRAIVMWDVDTEDWTGKRARDVIRAALKAKRGSIIVMHTDKANTVKALPAIIDGLRARGFTLVTVGQLIGLPGPVPVFMDRSLRDFQNGR